MMQHMLLSDKAMFNFKNSVFQRHLSICSTMCLFMQTCLEAPLEGQQKQHTIITVSCPNLSALSKI